MSTDFQDIVALVVDDSSTMVRIISNTLKRIGVKTIYTASDGLEGYNQFKLYPTITIILTDWNMPVMNGLEFIKKVRKDDKDIPIVMITTEGGRTEVITALKAGCNNYIVKPFTPIVLKEKLIDILI